MAGSRCPDGTFSGIGASVCNDCPAPRPSRAVELMTMIGDGSWGVVVVVGVCRSCWQVMLEHSHRLFASVALTARDCLRVHRAQSRSRQGGHLHPQPRPDLLNVRTRRGMSLVGCSLDEPNEP